MVTIAEPDKTRDYEGWLEWKACLRKVAFADEPIETSTLRSYQCDYCGLWHLTKR